MCVNSTMRDRKVGMNNIKINGLTTGAQSRGAEGGTNLSAGLAVDPKTEGWTWTQGGRKWHYYRNGRAICGGMMLFAHPGEGYELGNNDSKDNCAACKRKKLAEGG